MGKWLILLAATPIFANVTWDAERLEALRAGLAGRRTQAVIVSVAGQTLLEWYAPGRTAGQKHYTASLAKALIGGLSLQLALQDGKLTPETLAAEFIPSWRGDLRRGRITVRHLATHTSGLEDAEQDDLPHAELPGWKGEFWRRKPRSPVEVALVAAPVVFEPGAAYAYSNTGMAALGYVVGAALGGQLRQALADRVMRRAGVAGDEWQMSYGETWQLDGRPAQAVWGGGSFTPRAVARIGQMLANGYGAGVLQPAWTKRMTRYAGMPKPPRSEEQPNPASGLCWYTNEDNVWPRVPRDAFLGAGAGHQLLVVVPGLRLAAVRMGGNLEEKTSDAAYWRQVRDHFLHPLFDAMRRERTQAPYSPSPVFSGVEFAPEASIRRAACGSDNFPVTWMDDNAQFTAWGDGWGFEPLLEKKLSLGFSRITGGPDDFRAENVRSQTGERAGDGARGLKASGMVMVDGVLYMWVRNAGNARLAWSADRGKTWEWGFTLTESFASPAFLNFGRNYAGNRDGYVYAYSQDGPSAYEPAAGIVLARAPRARLRDRAAWEFFAGPGPKWTADIAGRAPVFRFPGKCERTDAVFHPASGRYLLAVGYNHEGGWGIYDAPAPWGPWTTVFHTDAWDQAGTHGYRLPAKWMEGDRMALVYSGVDSPGFDNDWFCVRRMRLQRRRPGTAR